MTQATKQQLLRKAAVLMGKEELAVRLKVPPQLLDAWINGQATMPDRKLVPLANVLDQFSTKP
jgi:hypothetical protein